MRREQLRTSVSPGELPSVSSPLSIENSFIACYRVEQLQPSLSKEEGCRIRVSQKDIYSTIVNRSTNNVQNTSQFIKLKKIFYRLGIWPGLSQAILLLHGTMIWSVNEHNIQEVFSQWLFRLGLLICLVAQLGWLMSGLMPFPSDTGHQRLMDLFSWWLSILTQ